MSSTPAATPGSGYRPKVKVYADEIPGWPRYPDHPSSDLSGNTAASTPTPSANHAAADGQATPTISAVDLQSTPPALPSHTSLAQTGDQVLLNASLTPTPQIAPSDTAVPSASFATTSGATRSIDVANAAGNGATGSSAPPYSAATQAGPSASPLPRSALGSQERLRLIKQAMGEK